MKTKLKARLKNFLLDQGGATAIEYALIASLISIAIIGSVVALNGTMVDMYEHIRSYIQPALEGD